MSKPLHRMFTLRQSEEDLEYIDGDDELNDYLDWLAPQIGWIIIYFNSLEDLLSAFIREAILRDPIQDERLDVFLAEMLFAGKLRALLHLYGQAINDCALPTSEAELNELERLLQECARRRNEYAHAAWIGMKKEGHIRVKAQSKKSGILYRYRQFWPDEVEADITFIAQARDALEEFNEKINDQIHGRWAPPAPEG